jgi:hypothetical protein
MPKGEDDWDAGEIAICVEQYVEVLSRGGASRMMPSRDIFAARAEKQLPKRNAGSVSRRMCNISSVLEKAGGKSVQGWKPLHNVGPTNTARILSDLAKRGVL